MKFEIKNRWTGDVQFVAEIDCQENESYSIKLGLAVRVAVKARANLADAYLAGANLADAYLAGANLAGANLARAYLADANLAGANLAGANLARANLAGANLADAYLARAYLADANLARGVKVYDYTFYRAPIQINDRYFINLWDGFLTIGCEKHLVKEWKDFDDKKILAMDGKEALKWWKVWKPILMKMAKDTGRLSLPKEKK